MKTNKRNHLMFAGVLGAAVLLLSGCSSQNFCSETDLANIAYPYDQGVTVYCDKNEVPAEYKDHTFNPIKGNTNVVAYMPVDASGNPAAKKSVFLVNTIKEAQKRGISVPSQEYWKQIDQKVLEIAIRQEMPNEADWAKLTAKQINPYEQPDTVGGKDAKPVSDSILRKYGYLKFLGLNSEKEPQLFVNIFKWNDEFKVSNNPNLGINNVASKEFMDLYKSSLNNIISRNKSCIATKASQNGKYGHYGPSKDWEVPMQEKDWGYAWKKGFMEGLIVYPVSWLVDTLAVSMDPTLSGMGQIWAIVITTIIIRLIIVLCTFRSTINQQKMQALQPEIQKIQAKYPNARENPQQNQMMAQEIKSFYKQHKINPASQFIVIFLQMFVFISVWGALSGSAVLSSGSVLNLNLSDTIKETLFNTSGQWWTNQSGWWTAFVLYILMLTFQFLAMKLPQWITKKRTKNIAKLNANPTQNESQNKMKWMMIAMFIFTAFAGFMLPSAMGVYWAIGAIISMIQTGVTQYIIGKQKNKKGKKAK